MIQSTQKFAWIFIALTLSACGKTEKKSELASVESNELTSSIEYDYTRKIDSEKSKDGFLATEPGIHQIDQAVSVAIRNGESHREELALPQSVEFFDFAKKRAYFEGQDSQYYRNFEPAGSVGTNQNSYVMIYPSDYTSKVIAQMKGDGSGPIQDVLQFDVAEAFVVDIAEKTIRIHGSSRLVLKINPDWKPSTEKEGVEASTALLQVDLTSSTVVNSVVEWINR